MSEAFAGIEAERDAIQLTVDEQSIGWVTFDRPGAKLNVLSSGVMKRFDEVITTIADHAATGRIKSVVIRSGKPGSFIAGADVNEIESITDPREGTRATRM